LANITSDDLPGGFFNILSGSRYKKALICNTNTSVNHTEYKPSLKRVSAGNSSVGGAVKTKLWAWNYLAQILDVFVLEHSQVSERSRHQDAG
jgi:hypothetical protein